MISMRGRTFADEDSAREGSQHFRPRALVIKSLVKTVSILEGLSMYLHGNEALGCCRQ